MHVLYKTYGGNVDRIIKGSFREVFIYYKKAIEEKEDDRLYQLWLIQFPYMTNESYISFNDYKRESNKTPSNNSDTNNAKTDNSIQYSNKTENELLQDAESILNMDIGKVHQIEVKV